MLKSTMPHVVIKTISGPSKQQLQEAADQISKIVNKTMGKPEKYISVSVEEYSVAEWEGVYNEYVKDKDNVIVKPGYTDPKTFN
jgi:phenylpyruvate tautomerase PptA (4-oxalocrotonate tautomerase family)